MIHRSEAVSVLCVFHVEGNNMTLATLLECAGSLRLNRKIVLKLISLNSSTKATRSLRVRVLRFNPMNNIPEIADETP
jgi:hypothetical protein